MQLHPNEPEYATQYTVNCLANKYVGLDFEVPKGDLTTYPQGSLDTSPNNIAAFANEVTQEDQLIIFHHNLPFALISNIGEYNYIKGPVKEMNIWFRHFRRFENISYFNDVFKQGRDEHFKIVMANTFSEATPDSETGKLIAEWLQKLGS